MSAGKSDPVACPFCSSKTELDTFEWGHGALKFYVYCRNCQAAGPVSDKAQEALERWASVRKAD